MLIKKGKFEQSFPRNYKTKIALLADMHVGYSSWEDYVLLETLFNNINNHNCDICLNLGDVLDSGYATQPTLMAEQSAIFYQKLKTLNIPHFAIQGNHDTGVSEFTRNGVMEINGVRFICFFASYHDMTANSVLASSGEVSTETLQFIQNELRKTKEEGKIPVICCHWAIANTGTKGFKWSLRDVQTDTRGATYDGHRDDILALCEQYGCQLYINGHEHAIGLINAMCDDTNVLNVEIGTATRVFATLEVYSDKFVFKEYDIETNALLNTLEVPMT